jgi:hypothetical protein
MRSRAARLDRALTRGRQGLRPGANALLGAAHSMEGECGVVEAWAGPQRRLMCVHTPELACAAHGRARARRAADCDGDACNRFKHQFSKL